jgi:hypothetical protein
MSTVSLCGRVLITATFSTATRSDEVNARPSSSSYPAITGVASVSVCAARFDQVRINAAGTPAISACPSLLRRPGDAEGARELVPQGGLVERAGGLLVRVDLVPVQRPPTAVGAAHLVQHERVGVQLRVAGARGAVVEHCCREPVTADLGVPVAAGT